MKCPGMNHSPIWLEPKGRPTQNHGSSRGGFPNFNLRNYVPGRNIPVDTSNRIDQSSFQILYCANRRMVGYGI